MASTVVGYADMDPSPRADVSVDAADLDGSTTSITIEQVSSAGVFTVRDAVDVASAGGFFITDYELPVGVPVEYRVAQKDVDGVSLGYAALSLTVQVDIADGMVVIQDPLIPANAVLLEGRSEFADAIQFSRPTRLYATGSGERFALLGARGLLDSVSLAVQTKTLADADVLWTILAETQVLVRVMPSHGRLPLVFHAVIPSPVQVPVDVQYGGEWIKWELGASQVSRTELEIIAAVVSWQRVIDYYATWSDLIADKTTWLELLSDPPPEA